MQMPKPDQDSLAKRGAIVAALRAIVPGEGVIASHDELRAYECDALTAYRTVPMAVVLPSTDGAGRGHPGLCDRRRSRSCRAVPAPRCRAARCRSSDGIVLGLGKFNRILDIDFENRTVTAQPGVTNLGITRAVEHRASTTRPTRPRRSPAPSAATSPRTRAACTA